MDILTIVLSNVEHGMSFQSTSFTSVVKFFPRCFIIFGAIVDGIVFLISLSALHYYYTEILYIGFVSCDFTEFIYHF